jgi:hypothetical protein
MVLMMARQEAGPCERLPKTLMREGKQLKKTHTFSG